MTKNWFRMGIVGIFLLALFLRFWDIDRFNTLVFDEVYFAKYGNNYLTRTPFFNAHPPLSQYIIGIGIWIGSHIPFWHGTVNGLTGSLLSPWCYRWLNALTGSFVPIIITFIAYHLSQRRSFALLAGFFTACDGLFLVESRYALNDIYIVFFGLLGQLFLILALLAQNQKRSLWLIISGIAFGASIGTKWNGLWLLSAVYLIWIAAWLMQIFNQVQFRNPLFSHLRPFVNSRTDQHKLSTFTSPLQNLTQINIFQMSFYLGIIPAVIYSIIWIPHLQLDKTYGFIAVHQQILQFHLHMGGNSPQVHPYCAAWYKWPLLTRPIAYYYQTAASFNEPLPVFGQPLPSGAGKVIYDVHALGNPFLWWFGLAAILCLTGILISKIWLASLHQQRFSLPKNLSVDDWIAVFLVFNYAGNLLPWVPVTRCVFIYHYMSAVIFTFVAIAWLVDQFIRSYYLPMRALGVTIIFIILGSFIFWMPIYLGLPLSESGYRIRMLFSSWI